jgi:hypothetical protein
MLSDGVLRLKALGAFSSKNIVVNYRSRALMMCKSIVEIFGIEVEGRKDRAGA